MKRKKAELYYNLVMKLATALKAVWQVNSKLAQAVSTPSARWGFRGEAALCRVQVTDLPPANAEL